MKLLNIALFVILNLCLVLAYPDRYQKNGYFTFQITGVKSGKATLSGLDTKYKNADTITIPEFFTVEGEKYYVISIMYGAFANNSNIKKVTFSPSTTNVKLENSSFLNCKNLQTVVFEHGNIEINSNAFSGTPNVRFDGSGVATIVNKLCTDLLTQWKLPVGYKKYDEAATSARDKKMTDLYALAKKLRTTFRVKYDSVGNNLLSVLVYHEANDRGFNLAFRELARVMGVNTKYFLTASDGYLSFWSYIKFNYDKWYDTWYNADIFNYDYSKYTGKTYPSDFFLIDRKYVDHLDVTVNQYLKSEIHRRPDLWLVYTARYCTDYEGQYSTNMYISDYIKQNNLGGVRD